MRAVLELAGLKDVLAKCYGSTTPVNVVRATLKALSEMEFALFNKLASKVKDVSKSVISKVS